MAPRFPDWLRRAKGCGRSPGGHGAAAPRAGALLAGRRGEPPGTEEPAAEGTGGGETGTQRREGCLQATSCHFVSFKRVGFPLSWSAVSGGGSVCPSRAVPRGGSSGRRGRAPRESAHPPQPSQPRRSPCHLRPRCSGFAGCSADLLLIATTRQRFAAFAAASASRYTFFCRPGYGGVAAARPHPSHRSSQGQ